METALEFLTTRKPVREVRRQWPDEVKAKIVSESFCRGIIWEQQTAKVCCEARSSLSDFSYRPRDCRHGA